MRETVPVRIFLVGSEFFASLGGIQRVNCLLLEMLAEFAAGTPAEVEVFSFGDQAGSMPPGIAAVPSFRWHAFDRSRAAMASQLGGRLREGRPDLILFTHAHLLRLARMTRLLRPRAKTAVLGHGVEVWEALPPAIRGWMQRAEAVIAPSAFTRDKIVEMNGVNPARVTVLPHGLDAHWTPSPRRSAPGAGKRLLSVTRLSRADSYKGVDVVLRVLPDVLDRHPEATYVVAGDGDDRPRLETIAREFVISGHVKFCGEVTGSKLHALYSEADLFVLPSREEGFGIVFLEAMSYGLPVVAARAGGTLEVIEDGVTGLLVPPEQPDALAGALEDLLGDSARLQALGEAGRCRVQENFLFEHFSRRWQRWLAGLLPEAVYRARQAAAFARVAPDARAVRKSAA